MASKLILPNGNLINPQLIQGVMKFPGKGVALRNEFNKILDFLRYPDERHQTIIITILHRVMSTRNWDQPDWEAEFATAP